jgi:ParB family chromosome partitioning protein
VSDLPQTAEVPSVAGGEAAEIVPQTAPMASDQTLASEAKTAQGATYPLEIPLNEVVANPHQPRRSFDPNSLAELAVSIKMAGVIQPIIVRKVDSGYQLIAGERRWRAAKVAGLESIPAIVKDVDAYTQAQMALIENIQREDLNPVDRAESYRSLMSQLGLTQAELAGRLGEDRSTIANYLRILDLSDAVRLCVRQGVISLGHAKILASITDPIEQERICHLVIKQDLSVRNLERLTQSGGVPDTAKKQVTPPSAHLQELERSITRHLGLRAQVRTQAKKGKGKLIIHYGNLDQFDELMKRIGVAIPE